MLLWSVEILIAKALCEFFLFSSISPAWVCGKFSSVRIKQSVIMVHSSTVFGKIDDEKLVYNANF